jgi:hypothetical protein
MISGYGPSGLIFRNELAISPAGISWKGKFHPLDSITRVNWGGVRKSVNGVYTGTDYTIGFGDNHSEQVIKLKQESIYNGFVEALWRAVCVRLVIEMLRALRAHTRPLSSPLDPGPVAALAPHHLVSLLEGALAFAILALLLLLAGTLLHWVLPDRTVEPGARAAQTKITHSSAR